MKKLFIIVLLSLPLAAQVTPNLNLNIPSPGTFHWGTLVNANFSNLDTYLACFGTSSTPGTFVYFDGAHWVCFPGNTAGSDRILQESGTGVPSWVVAGGGGGGGSPGGSTGSLQFNNAGSFGGFNDGASTTVLHGGRVFGPVSLATDVAGVLPTGNGGTNGLLPVVNGGTGTSSPSLVAGANVTITGSFPNQTINASGGGGGGSPGGSTGNLQYNNAGSFGGFPDGTSTQVLHGGRTYSAVSLANDVTGNLATSHFNSGTAASSSTFWRGDGTWVAPSVAGSPGSLKSMSSYGSAAAALNDLNPGQTMLVDGTFNLCNYTLSTANVVVSGAGFQSGVLQCNNAAQPTLTVSGNGVQIIGLRISHSVNPTVGGDGLVIVGGTTGVHVTNNLIRLNYNGLTVGSTSFGVIEGDYIENNDNHGINFLATSGIPVMQWEVLSTLSQKNLGNCFDMTLPASFNGVHNTGPTMIGDQAYGCAGYGFNFDAGSSTNSGISDVFMGGGTFSSTTNNSGFHFNNGNNGGRNVVMVGGFSELAGTYNGTAGYAGASQTPTNVGYGIEITSACDATQPPIISGILFWENSYSGVITACPGTTLNNLTSFKSGMALTVNSYQRAGVAIRASNVGVIGGYFRNSGGTQIYGVDVSNGADTPNVMGVVCDSSTTTCVNTSTAPANGFQSYIGNRRYIVGSGTPSMACSNGDEYHRSDAGNFSTLYACRNAAWGAIN